MILHYHFNTSFAARSQRSLHCITAVLFVAIGNVFRQWQHTRYITCKRVQVRVLVHHIWLR